MKFLFSIFALFYIIQPINSFFFPSSGSGGSCCACGAPPPPPPIPSCAPQPTCPPIVSCPTAPPPMPCCTTCSGCKKKLKMKKVVKREILSNSTYIAESDSDLDETRSKRETLESMENVKCNSDELRDIIEKKIDRVTAISKRRIQEEAETRMNGRFNVICARGDFSYVANTELYCQHTVGDVTCFLFKQLSDVVRRRLA